MSEKNHLDQLEELGCIKDIVGVDYIKIKSDGTTPGVPIEYDVRVVPLGGGELTSREHVEVRRKAQEEDLSNSIAMDDIKGDYSSVWLHVRYPPEYPDVDPEVSLSKIRGVSDDEFRELQKIMLENKSVEASSETVVIYQIWDALRSYLMDHNSNNEIELARRNTKRRQEPAVVAVPGKRLGDQESPTSSTTDTSLSTSPDTSTLQTDGRKRAGARRTTTKITDKKKAGKVSFKKRQFQKQQLSQTNPTLVPSASSVVSSTATSQTSSFALQPQEVSPSASRSPSQQDLPTFKDYEIISRIKSDTYTV